MQLFLFDSSSGFASPRERRLVFEKGKELSDGDELTELSIDELREKLKSATEISDTEGEGGAAAKRWDDVWLKIKGRKRLRRLKDAADGLGY